MDDCSLDERTVELLWVCLSAHKSEDLSIQPDFSDFEFELWVDFTELKLNPAGVSLTLPSDWAFSQWVLVYLFSDVSTTSHGFGTFVPETGSYERTLSPTLDLSPYGGTHTLRFGNNHWPGRPISNLRYISIFKSAAFHAASSNTLASLLSSKYYN